MRFIFKLIYRLFALLMLIFTLLYAYGVYLMKQAEEKEQALDIQIQSGNGFGGEAGMKIIDSDYSTRDFFWIDDDHLLFMIHRPTPDNFKKRDNYIWNLATGETLPLDIDGSASCFRDSYLYFLKVLNPNKRSDERGIVEKFRSKLVRGSDRWAVEEIQNIKEVWPDIPDRFEYAWRDGHECKPWYFLPRENRLPEDVPWHDFRYLSEWGWIFRRPRSGVVEASNDFPPAGFYEVSEEVYFGQAGLRKAPPPPIHNLRDIYLSYVEFLDEYWIAAQTNRDVSKRRYLALLDRNGRSTVLPWLDEWPIYDAIPLPTRKGIFWYSRNPGQGLNKSGGYILASGNRVHKVLHGAAENLEVSPDGCKVAFYHRPKVTGTYETRLRVFDTCKSSIQGREMTDVQYRDRTD